jgi:8-oxo-dGTP pyrophosphatase MutT (NUDIX family)
VAAVTSVRVSLVDVYVLRGAGPTLECLVLRRAAGGRCPGSWETVHGHIEPEETPTEAARRELAEETGLAPERLYNLSRVEAFYQHRKDEIALVPVFAAFVAADAVVRTGEEHDRHEWLPPAEAARRFAWPREVRALEDAVALLGAGAAGPVEDVLRVC